MRIIHNWKLECIFRTYLPEDSDDDETLYFENSDSDEDC
jgi:hypothetical protein